MGGEGTPHPMAMNSPVSKKVSTDEPQKGHSGPVVEEIYLKSVTDQMKEMAKKGGSKLIEENMYNDAGYQSEYAEDPRDWADQMQSDFASTGTKATSLKKNRKGMRKKKGTSGVKSRTMEDYSHEYRIKKKLLFESYYDKTTRPVRDDDTTTHLFVGMSLYHILDTVSYKCF